jgi:hypothetical protein
VAFRDSARSQAEQLGLSDWVRTLQDGQVEAVARDEAALCVLPIPYHSWLDADFLNKPA